MFPVCCSLPVFPSLLVQDTKIISQGHTLLVDHMTFDSAGTYVCVISVPEIKGMETRGTLDVRVRGEGTLHHMIPDGHMTSDLRC